jgi:hypothetical protein
VAVKNRGCRTVMKKRRFHWLAKILFPLKVQWDVKQRIKVTAVESSAVIGKNDYEALVGGGTKCSQEAS